MRQRLEVVSFRREVAFTLDLSGVVEAFIKVVQSISNIFSQSIRQKKHR